MQIMGSRRATLRARPVRSAGRRDGAVSWESCSVLSTACPVRQNPSEWSRLSTDRRACDSEESATCSRRLARFFTRTVEIVREPKEGHRDEPDFVLVPLADEGGGQPSDRKLPLEVKWSHNKECIPSLKSQLGQRYLLDQGLTHGLYVVGYSGVPPNDDLEVLRHKLASARDELVATHPHLRIGIVVLPLARDK